MKVLSYDVETANSKKRGSICAIGWVLLEDSQVLEKGYTLINPKCDFDGRCTKVHGITADDVMEAPTFAEYWESTLCTLMSKSLVIAHNASFDISATEQALFEASIPDPGIDYMDTLPVMRYFWDSESYKLFDLAAASGYTYQVHHAGEDALALVYVLNYLANLVGLEDIPALLIRSHASVDNTTTNHYRPKAIQVQEPNYHAFHRNEHCREEVEAEDSSMAGLRICITGDIPGYERAELEKIIMLHGGKPTASVSGKTDYLVVGTYEGYGEGYVSGKQKKALELIEQGGKVRIINPEALDRLIHGMEIN